MLVLVLVFRPSGILGERVDEGPGMSAAVQPMGATSIRSTAGRLAPAGPSCDRPPRRRHRHLPLPRRHRARSSPTRPLIVGVVSLGQAALLITFGVVGYLAGAPGAGATSQARAVAAGALAGAIVGAFLTALVLLGSVVDLRAVFLNASPELYALLTDGLVFSGPVVPIVVGAVTGALGGAIYGFPAAVRSPLLWGLGALLFFGLFAGLLRTPLLVTPLADLGSLPARAPKA